MPKVLVRAAISPSTLKRKEVILFRNNSWGSLQKNHELSAKHSSAGKPKLLKVYYEKILYYNFVIFI